MAEETMTLREVARRLALIKNPKARGVDVNKLHGLLRSGELAAGFYALNGTVWIDIPMGHWETTASNKLREKIVRDRADPNSGSYKLSPHQFPEQVAAVIDEQAKSNDTANGNLARLCAIVKTAGSRHEVTVRATVFRNYLQRHEIVENTMAPKGGRNRKEAWRELCSYVAAYLVVHFRDLPGKIPDLEATSRGILDLAKADGILPETLPAWGTLKEQISKALHLLQNPELNLKK